MVLSKEYHKNMISSLYQEAILPAENILSC